MKTLEQRLTALEALEQQRRDTAIDTALQQLTPAEFDAFYRYWHRAKGRTDCWPEADEIAAVARYEELVTHAYDHV